MFIAEAARCSADQRRYHTRDRMPYRFGRLRSDGATIRGTFLRTLRRFLGIDWHWSSPHSFLSPPRSPHSNRPQPLKATKTPSYSAIPVEAARQTNPVKSTPESLARAQKWWTLDGAMCHGKDGDGRGDTALASSLFQSSLTRRSFSRVRDVPGGASTHASPPSAGSFAFGNLATLN
jgi:hypothetical protein